MIKENVTDLARKWYAKIPFPACYDSEFEALLANQQNLECMPFASYDLERNKNEHAKNLVMFLYFCQELSQRYQAAGISEAILMATIEDFVISVERNYILEGSMGIVNANVLANHLSMRLFRLGRLQFCMTGAVMDIPDKGIRKGDPVIDVHVPVGSPLTDKECQEAFLIAEQFFATHFPEYHYAYYTCFSWLLDEGLQQFLKADSNILQFQKLFEPVYHWKNDSILNFVFRYGLHDREELKACPAKTDFAKKVREYALSGGTFYNVLGVKKHEQ